MRRPSIYALEEAMKRLDLATLVVTGDADDPCLEPSLFIERNIRSAMP